MNLYINTSSAFCELALFQEDKIVEHSIHEEAMKHSTVLHGMIEKLLEKYGGVSKITCITLLNGPGSYTGLRVGLAAAKGFCYALSIPLILLNKLDSLCQQYLQSNLNQNAVACLQAARQDEYFFCAQTREKTIVPAEVQNTLFIRETLSNLPNMVLISTDILPVAFERDVTVLPLELEFIVQLAQNRKANKKFNNIFHAEPFYLKKVHANLPKKRF